MFTKWNKPVGRGFNYFYGASFGPVFFVLTNLNIYGITRYRSRNEDDFSIVAHQGFPLGGVIGNADIFENNVFMFFSHEAKITYKGEKKFVNEL